MTTAHSPADVRHAAAVLDAYLADTGQDDCRHILRLTRLATEDGTVTMLGELADEHWMAEADRYPTGAPAAAIEAAWDEHKRRCADNEPYTEGVTYDELAEQTARLRQASIPESNSSTTPRI